MRSKLTGIAAVALVLGSIAPAADAATPANYKDITSQYAWAQSDIYQMTAEKVVHGYKNGTYHPGDSLTRGQLLAYFWNLVNPGVIPKAKAQYYADIPPKNWDYNYIGAAYQLGWIHEYWLNVRPGFAFNENFHASYGDAASFMVAYLLQQHKGFTTRGLSPLKWAQVNGLFAGIPSTENHIYLDRAAAAVFLANAQAYLKGPTQPSISSVSLSTTTTMVAQGSKVPLTVMLKDAQGNPIPIGNNTITYNVDNPNGYVDPNTGNLFVTAPGVYHITATVDGKYSSAPIAITVYGAPATIKLSSQSASLEVGQSGTEAVYATVFDANGVQIPNPTVTFTSSDPSVAKVSGTIQGTNGQVYTNVTPGTTSGTATITAIDGAATASANVTVSTNVSSISISGNQTVAVGGFDSLSATLKDASGNAVTLPSGQTLTWTVTGANAASATVSTNGSFVANTAGNYTVTASYGGVTSAPFTVSVFGQAAAIKLTAATPTIAANGASTDVITATVMDANGNAVPNFNGTITFSDTGSQLLDTAGNLRNQTNGVAVTNGVAKISIQASKSVGASDTITASNLVQTGTSTPVANSNTQVSGQVTVNQVAQVATSIKVNPVSSTVEVNQRSEDGFSVQVLDQSGQPMLTGSYPITLSLSGPATFDPATTTTTAYVGNGQSTNTLNGNIWSVMGSTGTIKITATSGSLSGSGTVNAVVVGSPTALKLALDPSSSSSFAAGSTNNIVNSSVFDLTTVDASGNTVTDPNNPIYTVTVWKGSTLVTSGVTANYSNGKIAVTGTVAGAYTLKVTSSDNLTQAITNFTITPNSPSVVAITSPANNIELPIAANTTTITAQLEDAYGNPITSAGVPVEFTANTKSGSDAATLGGSTAGTYTSFTNASGAASVSFAGSHTPGDAWNIGISSVNGTSVYAQPVTITMVSALATNVRLAFKDVVIYGSNNSSYLGNTTYAQGGDTEQVTITATDNYGNVTTNNDTVQIVLPAGLTYLSGGNLQTTATPGVYTAPLVNGSVTFDAIAAKAGVATLQAQDLSVGSSTVSGSGSVSIVPGAVTGANLFYNNAEITSSNPLSVSSNTPVQVWLKPTDSQGNPVTEGSSTTYFTLSDGGYGGTFKTATNLNPISVMGIPANSSGTALYYQNTNAGRYTLSAVSNATGVLATTTQIATSVTNATTVTAGSVDSVTMKLLDANGATVDYTNSSATVTATDSSGAVTVPTTVNFTNGVATFNVTTSATVGTNTFTLSVSGLGNVTSNPITIKGIIGAVSAATTTVTAPLTATAGSDNVIVKVVPEDANRNQLGSGQTVTVTDNSATPQKVTASWNAANNDYEATFTETTAGKVTFTATVGSSTMTNTASTTVNPATLAGAILVGDSAGAAISAPASYATLTSLAQTDGDTHAVSTTPYTLTIQGVDQYGNLISSTGGTDKVYVTFATGGTNGNTLETTASTPVAITSSPVAVTLGTNGTATLSYTVNTAPTTSASDAISISNASTGASFTDTVTVSK